MRILIAGAGAIGGWLGAKIAGHDVTLLGRQSLADAVAAEGLHVAGLTELTVTPRVITAMEGEFDLAFITCKAYQTEEMATQIAPFLARDGIVATMQNGLGNGEKIATIIAHNPVVVCLTSNGITVDAPGKLRHAGHGPTKVGPVTGRAVVPAVDVVAKVLTEAGLAPEILGDMRGAIWQKAIINAGLNPIAALEKVTNGALLAEPLASRAATLVHEAKSVAEAAKVALPPGDLVETLRGVCKATAENRVSMLQDVDAGRATEIEQISGRIIRVAKKFNVPVPATTEAYNAIKALEESYLGRASRATTKAEEAFCASV